MGYSLTDYVHFCFNSALLTEDGRQALRIMCANELTALMSPDSAIRIIAHTDRVGKPKDNYALSALRAANTLVALEDILGNRFRIPKSNQKLEGKGEREAEKAGHAPNKPNADDRRVDIYINGRSVISLNAE